MPSIMIVFKRKIAIWLLVAAGLLLFAGANMNLVYVATSSQPDCVAHIHLGEVAATRGRFSAAASSCAQE